MAGSKLFLAESFFLSIFATRKYDIKMNFESLVGRINTVQDVLQAQAAHAINLALTARNWLVGYYIVEFEQNGEDRAKYGENLLNRLSKNINRKGFEPRSLRLYRRFYLVYPQLGTEIGSYLRKNSLLTSNSGVASIWQAAPAKLQASDNQIGEIWQAASAKLEEWCTPPDRLFCHRRPLAKPLRQQVPAAAALGGRNAAVSA